jgi:nitrate/nitrite transporter NarK
VRTWHIALPALIGGISIPLALFAGSPAATIAVITITAMSIFAALPNFWTVPTQFLTGAAAAAGIALINTVGNLAGFSAGYITGWLKDLTGGYTVPMFVVGGFMLLSSILMVTLSRQRKASEGIPAEALDPQGAGHHAEP